MADFTLGFQLIQYSKYTSIPQNLKRRAMDLIQINRFALQAAQALLGILAYSPCRIVIRIMNVPGTAKFRGNMYMLLLAFGCFGKQLFGMAGTVYISAIAFIPGEIDKATPIPLYCLNISSIV